MTASFKTVHSHVSYIKMHNFKAILYDNVGHLMFSKEVDIYSLILITPMFKNGCIYTYDNFQYIERQKCHYMHLGKKPVTDKA